MNHAFWLNTFIYYTSIYSLIVQPSIPAMVIATVLFLSIPFHASAPPLMQGLDQSINAQIETLKTQRYLNKKQ